MLRPSPNHGTERLPNDDDDVHNMSYFIRSNMCGDVGVKRTRRLCMKFKLFIMT